VNSDDTLKNMGEPREIYQDACLAIANAFEAEGFRWRKSQCDLVKKDRGLTFEILFQSSPRNQLIDGTANGQRGQATPDNPELFLSLEQKIEEIHQFGSISFIVHLSVGDESVKKWRASLLHPVSDGGVVAGTNIGYVSPKQTWLEVNLANPYARSYRIAALIDLTRSFGFPYFDQFHFPGEVVNKVVQSDIPGISETLALEFAVFYGDHQTGRRVIDRYFQKWPDCKDEYQSSLRKYRENGIPSWWDSSAGPRLAKAAMMLGIEK
jgi:hypothetical protein